MRMDTTKYMASDTLNLRNVGRMLGDDPGKGIGVGVGLGPQGKRLAQAASFGSLATVEDPHWITVTSADGTGTYHTQRERLDNLTVTRRALRAWLTAHGTPTDLQSAAARWAGAV
jgi:hypothetical protein